MSVPSLALPRQFATLNSTMSNANPQRPNVVVFFTDQQRWDCSSLHGCPLDLMPNFDAFARQNTHLRRYFTCQPVCGPARACLQTGTYATTTGVVHNGIQLPPDLPALGTCFSAAGYRTGYIGKWHLAGHDNPYGPVPAERRGGYQDWLASEILEFTSDEYHCVLYDDQQREVKLPGYRVDAMTDAGIRYIHQRAGETQPFFLTLSFLEPHHQNDVDDYPPPRGYRERYAGRWTPPDLAGLPSFNANQGQLHGSTYRHLAGYFGMVKRLDEAFGRVLDTLHSLGIENNTIVLFISDHGCHFRTRNAEYKRSCHESSIRVPCALGGPGFVGGGQVQQLISLVDIAPTLLDAAGIGVPATMQGRSLLPLLRGQHADWPDDVYVQISESCVGRAVRTRRWKYAVTAPAGVDARQATHDVYHETHLYDLQYDPYELQNVLHDARYAPVAAVLRERLVKRMQQVGEPGATIVPVTYAKAQASHLSEAEWRQ